MRETPLRLFFAALLIVLVICLVFLAHYGTDWNTALSHVKYNKPRIQLTERGTVAYQPKNAVVCMIFTTPDKWSSRGRAVRSTWAKRCPFPLFFYSSSSASSDHDIRRANNTVGLDVPDGRHRLTDKTLAGLRYSFANYGHVAEWFMKADDDTYVIWENLDYLLEDNKKRNVSDKYLGRKFFTLLPNGYTSGGAGYLIAKSAVELIVNEGPKTPDCAQHGGIEDYDIGKCLEHFSIFPGNTLDEHGRLKFHSDNPVHLLNEENPWREWYHINLAGNVFGDPNTTDEMLSRLPVTFHYITPGEILMFDYLLYHVQRAGRTPFLFDQLRRRLPSLHRLPVTTTPSSTVATTGVASTVPVVKPY